MIGMLTPPLGICLYIAADIAKMPFEKVFKAVIPFYVPLIVSHAPGRSGRLHDLVVLDDRLVPPLLNDVGLVAAALCAPVEAALNRSTTRAAAV